MNPEGWYEDPFDRHGLRWFSAGTPTDLVRDGDVEAYDAPPQDSWDGALVPYLLPPAPEAEAGGDLARAGQIGPAAADLQRADDAETVPYDPARASDAALDRAAASGLGFD